MSTTPFTEETTGLCPTYLRLAPFFQGTKNHDTLTYGKGKKLMQKRRDEVIHALLYAALAYIVAYPLWLFLGASYLRTLDRCNDALCHFPKILLTPATTGSVGLFFALVFVPCNPASKRILALLFMLSLIPSTRELLTIAPSGLPIKWELYQSLSFVGYCLRSFSPLLLFGVLLPIAFKSRGTQ
ncbi:hypothetical protein [Armatimonas rosea]|uniref:Transmembrane protein n=1 Tax=Armatimonas rosea TaxID=685828 RepID=A0A7W9W6P6_ARMRO|nr:hypothetical protein [Armatimonas rosea]MBB6049772.1 hypothetical protein [Armatimonas rosea]